VGYLTHALETMRAIDAAIEADQGASFRGWQARVLPHIGDAYRTDTEGHRSHLGASLLGQECARAIWYGFRWVTKSKFEARILRLFNRGHLEEGRIISQLLMIGVQVWQQDNEGKQFRISWAEGHAGGSGDGVALGIPDARDTSVLLEFKTHGEKSFIELAGTLASWRAYVRGEGQFAGKGVKAAKPEHYIQMQAYMRKMGLTLALYVASCKNTDDQYMELVKLEPELADQYLDRGEKIVWLDSPPDKINSSPGFFKCRFCDHRPTCHLRVAADRNCRTCRFSRPLPGARWSCIHHGIDLSKELQQTGCADWIQDPSI
jgi:hypothetical protein